MRPWSRRASYVAVVLLGLAGAVHALLFHRTAVTRDGERIQAHFGAYVQDRAHSLEREVLDLTRALHGLGSLYDASTEVTREEFAIFTRDALARNRAIQALEWIPCVPGSERDVHESSMRREGLVGYRITESAGTGLIVEARPRDVYYPVCFVEPHTGNERAVGFDLGSEPTRRRALERALASYEPAISDPLVLVQESAESKGILFFLAVRNDTETPPDSGPCAHDASGLVLLVSRIEAVLDAAHLTDDTVAERMRFRLTDADADGGPALLYASGGNPDFESAGSKTVEIRAGGHRWHLQAAPAGVFLPPGSSQGAVLPAIAIFLGWLLLGGLLLHLGGRSGRLTARRQDLLLKTALHDVSEGVAVANCQGQIMFANPAAAALLGLVDLDADPASWSDTYGCFLSDGKTPYPPDQLPLARAIRGEHAPEETVFIRNAKRPEGVWLNSMATPLRQEDGRCLGGVLVMRDVSVRRASEEAMKRLSSAVEATADVVMISDRNGRIIYTNPAFETVTGYTQEEALGETPRILASGLHKKEHYEALWKTILGGDVWQATAINQKKNGDVYYSEQTITPMKGPDGQVTHFVSVARDMTEQRKLQEKDVEMRVAAEIQQRLYPTGAPPLEGVQLAGIVYPAELTCGDYYDYFLMQDGSLGLVIGDVSGHGLGPAMIMVETRANLRSQIRSTSEPAVIVQALDEALGHDLEDHRFVTLFLGRMDLERGRLVYASAGHAPGYVITQDGELREELDSTGPPLGLLPGSRYETLEAEIHEGDLIVLFTDGVPESQTADGTFFGEERVLETVCRHAGTNPCDIVTKMHDAVNEFTGGRIQADDVTMLVCRVPSREVASAEDFDRDRGAGESATPPPVA